MGMFYNMRQDSKIRAADSAAASAGNKAKQAEDRVKELHQRLDHLTLYCQAMWELIRENTRLEEQDLLNKAREIDERDGKADGKIGVSVVSCPSCGRNSNSTKKACMYCGVELERQHIFEG